MTRPEMGTGHRCDADCRCPVHGTPLLYSPAADVHACQDPGCALAHGARRTLTLTPFDTEYTAMDDFSAPPARPDAETLRSAGQWLASVRGLPGVAVGQTGWVPAAPAPDPTPGLDDLVQHGAHLRMALDLIEFEAADELRPYDADLHTIARRVLAAIEQVTGSPLTAGQAVPGPIAPRR